MAGKFRFNLAKLNPEAPDLHLEVVASQELDIPVCQIPANQPEQALVQRQSAAADGRHLQGIEMGGRRPVIRSW